MRMILITESRLDELFDAALATIAERLNGHAPTKDPNGTVVYYVRNLQKAVKDGPLGT